MSNNSLTQSLSEIEIESICGEVTVQLTPEPKIISVDIRDKLSASLEEDIATAINAGFEKGKAMFVQQAINDLEQI